jgi:hypothetical protein
MPALILFLDAPLLALNALLLLVIIYLLPFLFLALPQHFPENRQGRQRKPWKSLLYLSI